MKLLNWCFLIFTSIGATENLLTEKPLSIGFIVGSVFLVLPPAFMLGHLYKSSNKSLKAKAWNLNWFFIVTELIVAIYLVIQQQIMIAVFVFCPVIFACINIRYLKKKERYADNKTGPQETMGQASEVSISEPEHKNPREKISKFMIWVRGFAVLSVFLVICICLFLSESTGWFWVPLVITPFAAINLWAILKKTSGKALKTGGTLTALVVPSVAVWIAEQELRFNWFGIAYSRHSREHYLDAPDFFLSVGLLLLLILNLIAVLRPKIPAFLKETKKENPHLLVAYGFATVLCILLSMLIFVIAMK